jgi:hypothetical protein
MKNTLAIHSLAASKAADWSQLDLDVNLSITEHAHLIMRYFLSRLYK